jgi:hypothetical protein
MDSRIQMSELWHRRSGRWQELRWFHLRSGQDALWLWLVPHRRRRERLLLSKELEVQAVLDIISLIFISFWSDRSISRTIRSRLATGKVADCRDTIRKYMVELAEILRVRKSPAVPFDWKKSKFAWPHNRFGNVLPDSELGRSHQLRITYFKASSRIRIRKPHRPSGSRITARLPR